MSDKTLFNIEEVQEILDISERTVFRYIEEGELQGLKVGREWRFTQEDLDAFMELRRKKTEEEMREKRQKRKTKPRLPTVKPKPDKEAA